jgi:hypothetical protein
MAGQMTLTAVASPAGPDAGEPAAAPSLEPRSASEAIAAIGAGLAFLNGPGTPSLTGAELAECLRGLAGAESALLAARSAVLSAFAAGRVFEADGQCSARAWLRWQTRVTGAAAGAAVSWARRLAAHPAVAAALAGGVLSGSWARAVCEWSDALPEEFRGDADVILTGAAAGGAELGDLAALAEEMRARAAGPDPDRDGEEFDERGVRLETTLDGAGCLSARLTPECAAALRAVLDVLGKKAGPEDERTRAQREHDALEEACRRLIGAGCLPGRAGQPTQIVLHLTLERLRRMSRRGRGAAGAPGDGEDAVPCPGPAAGPGYDCDAQVVPVVTGTVDEGLLARLAGEVLAGGTSRAGCALGAAADETGEARQQRGLRAARDLIASAAADLLSGPRGLAAALRAGLLSGPAASPSLPLDVGTATDTIPAHLRRAVAVRDRRCRFPGCAQPLAACQPHHLIPRSEGGPTSLANLLSLCSFHHLIAVHRWGWRVVLHGDGTVTATSPDGQRSYRDHGPPASTG